jgi:hypothetical protein
MDFGPTPCEGLGELEMSGCLCVFLPERAMSGPQMYERCRQIWSGLIGRMIFDSVSFNMYECTH